jgi:cytochrome P450
VCGVIMNSSELFAQILDPTNRPNPYPLYSQLRATPVAQQEDGTYVVSTWREIQALLHDPRISSDERKSTRSHTELAAKPKPESYIEEHKPFIFLDPPDHTRLRRLVMREFNPKRVEGMHDRVIQVVNGLLDAQRDRSSHLDIVDDFAHPLPVNVISEMLGVPPEDRPRLEVWVPALIRLLEPKQRISQAELQRAGQASMEMTEYLGSLIAARRARPADDMISGLVAVTASSSNDPAMWMSEDELKNSVRLLLGAGYETTVNLIANGMLALLRHPHVLERLRRDPNSVFRIVEEVLWYDPPVHFRTRTTLTDIDIAGVTIPKGASVVLLFASGSRDPARFANPDQFDPDRTDNDHLGFGGGIHYCVGAPLARIETHVALSTLARRLVAPRLVTDPLPYRDNASLRGPQQLMVAFDHIDD